MTDESLVVSLKRKEVPPPPPMPPQMPRRTPSPRRNSPLRTPLTALFIIVTLCIATYLIFFRSSDAPEAEAGDAASQQEANEAAAAEVQDVIQRVSQLIVLPEGEEPTVATVSDPEKLRGQPFFENAKAGHKVLIYTKARKAYLYDPAQHKLIEVAPITTQVQ